MKAIAWTIWFFVVPKSPFDVVSKYTATLMSAIYCVTFLHRLWWSILGIAFLWDFAIGLWLMISVISRANQSLLAVLMEMKDCSYHSVELSSFLSSEQRETINQASLLEYLGARGLPWQHERDVRAFLVNLGPSRTMPPGLAAFNIPFVGAILLIRDNPVEGDARDRFCFWHEVGHTLGGAFARRSIEQKGAKGTIAAILPSLLIVQWNMSSLLIVLMLSISLLGLMKAFWELKKSSRLDDEIAADRFAVQLLDDTDIEYLRAETNAILPDDSGLSEMQNRMRGLMFSKVLESQRDAVRYTDDSMREFLFEGFCSSLHVIAWLVLWVTHFRMVHALELKILGWSSLTLLFLCLIRYARHYFSGILIELVLSGSRIWKDGKFHFGRSRA